MSDDMTIGEIQRDLRNIHHTLEDHRQQISKVRHDEKELQGIFKSFETIGNIIREEDRRKLSEFQSEVRADISEINEKLSPIHDFVTGQRGVESYRKWLIATVVAFAGVLVAFIAFVLSVMGGTG